MPTPIPTPGVAAWTGLDWGAGSGVAGKWLRFNDIVAWRGGYVGVGSSRAFTGEPPTSPISPAFFTSADALHWTIAQEGAAVPPDSDGLDDLLPTRVVVAGDRLLAIGRTPFGTGAPLLWSSEDGSTWAPLDSPSWRDALAKNTLLSAAAGPAGVVAVGYAGSGDSPQGAPVILHSADGLTWDRLNLSAAFDKAYLRDVTAYAGGFVIVGRVGEPNARLADEHASGVPAAWSSADGVKWLAAEVEGSEAPGASLLTVVAGADGLFATGYATEWTSWQSPRSGWASTDGRSWKLVGEIGMDLALAIDLPWATGYPSDVVGDGAHMTIFGRTSCKTTELSAWTSLDGVSWTRLTFSGETSYLPIISGPICNDDGTEGSVVGSVGIVNGFAVPGGVFVVTSSSAPAPPGLWFLKAVTN